MKSAAVFAGIVVVGGVMAIGGGMDLGSLSSPPFNYETSSAEERTEFLKSEARPFGKALKIGLVNPSGVGTTMRVARTDYDARAREITYIIKVRGGMQTGDRFDQARDTFLKRMCPKYAPSPLGKANVRLVQKFVDKKDQTLTSITVSASRCRQYL